MEPGGLRANRRIIPSEMRDLAVSGVTREWVGLRQMGHPRSHEPRQPEASQTDAIGLQEANRILPAPFQAWYRHRLWLLT